MASAARAASAVGGTGGAGGAGGAGALDPCECVAAFALDPMNPSSCATCVNYSGGSPGISTHTATLSAFDGTQEIVCADRCWVQQRSNEVARASE